MRRAPDPGYLAEVVPISLSRAEWLLLGDKIGKVYANAEDGGLIDRAERQAFWNLESEIEKIDAIALLENYSEFVALAKKTIVGAVS